jgi:signal peptidase I
MALNVCYKTAYKRFIGKERACMENQATARLSLRSYADNIWELGKVIIQAALIALVIRTALFQPFSIPSESMLPTLMVGDYLLVEKYAYGYSRHAIPFSPPLFSGRLFSKSPARDDVAVFKLPSNEKIDYIKRVVGLPGDTIQVLKGELFINGEKVERELIDSFVVRDIWGQNLMMNRYRETLPGAQSSHVITVRQDGEGYWNNTPIYRVPDGHYFMLGDNRDNSKDSRDTHSVGYVSEDNFVGRAAVIFYSKDTWPWFVRWGRLFSRIV